MSDDEQYKADELDLQSLQVGDRLHIRGDEGERVFTCVEWTPSGPVGSLVDGAIDSFKVVQLLGTAPHSLKDCFSLRFEPHVLMPDDGRLVMMETTSSLFAEFVTIHCAGYKIEK